jgi:hypothetical protein
MHDVSGGQGFLLSNCNVLYAQELQVANNSLTAGIFVSTCENLTLEDSNVNNNMSVTTDFSGFIITTSSVGTIIRNCQANNNSSTVAAVNGFSILNSADAVVEACQALANTASTFDVVGFNVASGSTDITVRNCTSESNISSSANGYGFVCDASLSQFFNNISLANTTYGFDDTGTSNVFFGNYAQGNGTNYNGVAPVTTYTLATGAFAPATPVTWQNISAV